MSSAINNESSQGAGAPRASILRQLCAVRPIDPAPQGKSRLKQVLSARALLAIGLGATIGSGIFVLTGAGAANHAGSSRRARTSASHWLRPGQWLRDLRAHRSSEA